MPTATPWSARGRSLLIGLVAIGAGAAGTAAIQRARRPVVDSRAAAAAQLYSTESAPVSFMEEDAIFIGSPTCGASKIRGLPAATQRLIDSLRAGARARGDSFATVGVSLDGPFDSGRQWLDQFGQFDEVTIGRNWLNSEVASVVWSDADATPAIPQLVLVRHHVTRSLRSIQVGANSVVRRWVGVGDLAPAIAKRLVR